MHTFYFGRLAAGCCWCVLLVFGPSTVPPFNW